MASKMKKKEIEEFIKSKSTTQDTYIAPTVRTHVDTKVPAMAQVAQTVKPTIGQTAGYIGKAAKTGLVGGVTSVPTSNLQEIEGGLKKGKNIKNVGDVAKQIVNSLSTISNITNPLSMQNVLNTASNMSKSTKKALKDKNKDALSKALSIGTAAVSNVADMANPTHQLAESVFPLVGAVDKKSDQKVRNLIDTINKPNEKLQQELAEESQNHGKVANMVASGVQAATNMIPSLAATAITKNPNIGMAVMANNVKGQATEEALKQGKSLEEAREIGNVRAAAEVATEMLSGGLANIYGKGATDDVAKNLIDNYIQNPTANFLATKASGIVGENVEESLSNILNKAIDKGTVDPNAKITMNDITEPWGPTTISTLLLNGATGDYSRASFNQNAAQLQSQSPITKVQNMNDVERNALTEITMKRKQGIPLDENDIATINYLNNRDNVVADQNIPLSQNVQQTQENNFVYEPTDNVKINNFRQSASQFMNNSEAVQSLANNIEKVINDKNYNITFDDTIGDGINGRIGINENGEVEIKINPNSERAGEFVLTHEITHAIETKDMRDLVMDYASKNSEFASALKTLQEKYGTEDVSDEVLADISGNLFGDEAFITNLSTTKPNIFKRFYNTIMSLANKITGNSNEALFIKDLKNKWEKAYREADTNTAIENLNGETKLALSKDALKEVSDAINETQQQAANNSNHFLKLKDNTIKSLVDYGVSDLPMMANRSHVRENVLTAEEAKKLGYSTSHKHFHGLGVKTYLEIIDSMDNPIGVYQYTDKGKYDSNNFIVLTPIEIDGKKAIVPVEINKKGQYNQIEIDYNKIKTSYAKDNENYINNLLKKGKIKEIFAGSDSQRTSLTDNNIPQGNKNVKYSISEKTGKLQDSNGNEVNIKTTQSANDKNLMVMQGLSVDNLKNVLSLGGLPVPSLGITNTKYTDVFDEFGGPDGAVLLFSKDTINPKIKGNEVYSRDVYSKTVPEIYQKVDKRAMNKVMDEFRPYESEYGTFNKHDYSKSSLDSIVNDLSYSSAAKAKFLDDNGYKFDKAYRGYKSSYGFTEEVIDKFLRENPDLASFNPMSADTTTEVENIAPRVKEAAIDMMAESNPKFSRKQFETLFKDKWYFNDVVQFYRDINEYRNLNGQKEFDIYTTRDNIDAAVEPHKQEFESWLRNKFKDVYGDKYFENDSGKAKEYTLENLTSYMKRGNTQAQQKGMFDTFGIGQAKGGAAQQFKTIEQIREASSKLVDADTYKERHKAFEDIDEDVRTDIGDTRISKGEDLFDVYSDYYMALSKAASGVDPETALKNNYFTDLSKEQIEKFTEISQALANLPAKYFEAKPQRSVGLDEIKGIAVPNTIDAELREQLLNNGFTLAEYDPKVEGDKQRVINQFDDLKFSKQNDEWYNFLDKNFKGKGNKTPLRDLKALRETKNAQSKAKISGSDEISAKKDESVITVRNNKGQELKLKQDKTNPNVYEKEVKIPKDNKSIVPKETMQKQLAKLKDGTKVSNFYSNLTENSKFITQENASKLSQEEIWRYAPQTNKETMANAEARIGDTQKSLETAYGDFLSKGENFSPEDVGVGWILLKRFQDAGNYDAMVQVAKKMRNIATKSGQTVQMFNLQSRLTPEGMVKYAQSELMEAEQQFNKGKSQKEIDKYAKDFELTGEEVEFIKNQMEKIQGMEDGRAKNIEMAKINKMLSDKLPHQRGDSIKAWMRMSMLFNPKTQVRNVVGNALITPINALADVPASIADKAISKKTGTRTIGAPSLSGLATYGKGFAKGGVEAWQDYRMGLDTKDVDMSRFDITQKNPFVTDHKGAARVLNPISKGLNKANSFLDLVMSGGDRVFYQGAFDASLRNQMELNNVKTPTQDMIDIATQEALSRTWNDNNGYTQFVLNTRRALNKASIGGYGLGDVLIPFAKTPANLTKAIYDYSPVGLTTTLFKTKSINNAIETGQITAQMQHDFAQNLGKGVAGTMLYAMAYALAKAGIATGSSDDDKDVANFIKNTMGIQPYSIKIGDKSFTYDWAQPVAAPIAIASDAYQNLTRDSDEDTATRIFNTILDVSNTGFNVLMQQSFLQGISEVLNSNEGVANGIIEQVIGLPARAVPTFVQQINNMFDKTQRVAFEKNQPLKTGKQNVMSKLPGQSQRLAPRVDALGNEVQRYGDSESDLTYALKNFLSPANQSNRKTSKAASEIYDVYEATGDKTIMPMVAPYYIQNKTVGRIDLDSKDRATYQKISGKLINDAVVELTNDVDYNKLSYDEKAEVLNGVVSYANAKAKEHFTGFMANTYNPANKKINNGMSIADYYLEKTMNKR